MCVCVCVCVCVIFTLSSFDELRIIRIMIWYFYEAISIYDSYNQTFMAMVFWYWFINYVGKSKSFCQVLCKMY